ncbi:uncharacterized protein KQ657_004435 [Scheffersomyces spartinae]|uniref:LisH domain-containing protein n=1 Tax=Scheffersomyces spartinae TaxID=45513 RepID=A0A9P7VBN1_9ASCO|nr:uncharacterized protein KQ657_004435 [Scheffersomyces spartinae]KAG7194755.1 hypothetical protein KQ657_004435 [Scheffersomyces spartinae]
MHEFVYVIPPYILETCRGLEIQRLIAKVNERLAERNVIGVDSEYFIPQQLSIKDSLEEKLGQAFDVYPKLREVVEEKAIRKLSIGGYLGVAPEDFDRSRLNEFYNMYKGLLFGDENDLGDNGGTISETKTHSSSDIEMGGNNNKLRNMSLSQIFKTYIDKSSFEVPFFVNLNPSAQDFDYIPNDGSRFSYPLPYLWSPLVPGHFLNYLTENLNLSSSNTDGYCHIRLSSEVNEKAMDDAEDYSNNRAYNFITNNPVNSLCGVYYYEVKVKQIVTSATKFKPILVSGDGALYSSTSLGFSMGFVKREILYDEKPKVNSLPVKLDLDSVKRKINQGSESINNYTELLLGHKAGELNGLFAFSFFENSFWNSLKNAEYYERPIVLNRRLSNRNMEEKDLGRTELDFQFVHRHTTPTNEVYASETVGCGINFIKKEIFITLNGALVKKFPVETLNLENNVNNIFSEKSTIVDEVFPIFGFKINSLENNIDHGNADLKLSPTTVDIETNLGFREFVFPIRDYVNDLKQESQNVLQLPKTDNDKDIVNLMNHDTSSINGLIQGYLIKNGYMETLNSFKLDLDQESQSIGKPTMENVTLEARYLNWIDRSRAKERLELRELLSSNDFEGARDFIFTNYREYMDSEVWKNIIFRLDYLACTFILKELDQKGHDSDTFLKFYNYCLKLESESKQSPLRLASINKLFAVSMVKQGSRIASSPYFSELTESYDRNLNRLIHDINAQIIRQVRMDPQSKLERIFQAVDKNISILGLEHNDNDFKLVNFKNQHLEGL